MVWRIQLGLSQLTSQYSWASSTLALSTGLAHAKPARVRHILPTSPHAPSALGVWTLCPPCSSIGSMFRKRPTSPTTEEPPDLDTACDRVASSDVVAPMVPPAADAGTN